MVIGGGVPELPPPPPPQALNSDRRVATHKTLALAAHVNEVGRGKMRGAANAPAVRDFTYRDIIRPLLIPV